MPEYKIGMKVKFGRPNGQKTIGEIVKVNAKTVKVKTHEARGRNGRSRTGTIWGVPKNDRVIEIVSEKNDR
tara:strand:+ start:309 stop:521 length:213 start_codon:yes stop_codon:yes gene_type:complete